MHPTLYTPHNVFNSELTTKKPLQPLTRRISPLHSEFTDSPLESSSSGEIDSFSKSRETSRPSSSSDPILNQMQRLMAPVQLWPPMVIQLEEAPEEAPQGSRTNFDTHGVRMNRIDSWRKDSATLSSHSQGHARSESPAQGVREQLPSTLSENTRRSKSTTLSSSFRCTACDTCYATRQGLKRHAQGVRTSPACRTAVAYYLE